MKLNYTTIYVFAPSQVSVGLRNTDLSNRTLALFHLEVEFIKATAITYACKYPKHRSLNRDQHVDQ